VNAVVCPVGKVKIVPCRAQQILGASLVLSDAPAFTMERVDRMTVSVDALMDGWDLNATRVNFICTPFKFSCNFFFLNEINILF